MLIVLTLVNDEELYAGLAQNMAQTSRDFRLCALRGAAAMTSGYNALVAASESRADDVLCFIHQDARLYFDAAAIIPQYLARLPHAGVLGFCGSNAQKPDQPWYSCPPCFGGLLQGREQAAPLSFAPPTAEVGGLGYAEVQTVDGYCLFVSRAAFDRIGGFDEEYEGWHGYDIDLCVRALRCGYRNYVIAQPSQHYSSGSANQDLTDSLAVFGGKWSAFLEATAAPLDLAAKRDEARLGRLLHNCAVRPAEAEAWFELSDHCRLEGDHPGSYWAAKRALALPPGDDRGSSKGRWRLHDLVSIAAWYLGLREESRQHSLLALDENPYDDRLIENYRRIQELSATGLPAEGPPVVDVVILAYSKTRREYEMTKDCIRYLRLSSPGVPLRIVVVETNTELRRAEFAREADLFAPGVSVVWPGGRFSFNTFLRVGYEACEPSPARYFMALNNDVALFANGFLEDMLAGLASVESVSPLCFREKKWGPVDTTVPLEINYDINRAMCGWCVMFDKKILDSVPFEVYFPDELIWYGQDEHYAATLRSLGYKHGRVTAARALHLHGWSHHLLGETLAPPASRMHMLRDLGIRHKRCVVIGSHSDDYIGDILDRQPAKLVLVEPWRHDGPELCHRDSCAVAGRGDGLEIVSQPSLVAANDVADESLDFVYIDASGAEESVGADIGAWWPKLKPGGWLAGRDYDVAAVQEAVACFCRERGAKLAFVTRDAPSTWAIQASR